MIILSNVDDLVILSVKRKRSDGQRKVNELLQGHTIDGAEVLLGVSFKGVGTKFLCCCGNNVVAS